MVFPRGFPRGALHVPRVFPLLFLRGFLRGKTLGIYPGFSVGFSPCVLISPHFSSGGKVGGAPLFPRGPPLFPRGFPRGETLYTRTGNSPKDFYRVFLGVFPRGGPWKL